MRHEVIAQGKSVDEARENARLALGATEMDDVQYEVIDLGTRGIFGIGARPTKIKAYMEFPDAPQKHKRGTATMSEEEIQLAIAEDKKEKKAPKKFDKPKAPKADAPKTEEKVETAEAAPAADIDDAAEDDDNVTLEEMSVSAGEDMSMDFVSTLIGNLGIDASAKLYKCSNGTRRIVIDGTDAGSLIGHRGETLDAIQYLSNLACIKKNIRGERDKSRVTIDINGYRSKREETLRALARKMAAKALRNKKSVVLDPMNAYERRIIHSEVHLIEGVTTNSIGKDSSRRVVIYIPKKGASDKSGDNE